MFVSNDLLITAAQFFDGFIAPVVFTALQVELPEGWSLKVSDLFQIVGLIAAFTAVLYGAIDKRREAKKGNLDLRKSAHEQLREENRELMKTVTRLRKSEDKMLLLRQVVINEMPNGVEVLKRIEKEADDISSFEP